MLFEYDENIPIEARRQERCKRFISAKKAIIILFWKVPRSSLEMLQIAV